VYSLSERELGREPPEVRLRLVSKVQKRNPNSDKARWAFHAKKPEQNPTYITIVLMVVQILDIATGTCPVQKMYFFHPGM
jgi:hypothetical protein